MERVGMVLEATQSRRRSTEVMLVCFVEAFEDEGEVAWWGFELDCEDRYHSLIELFKVLLLTMSGRPVGWFGGVL